MERLRTPDTAFINLPDFPYSPQYLEVAAPDGPPLRMAYLDEGPRDAPIVLMLHGEPSWSFLYRHVIRVVTAAGLRAIAPDLIGFGRSDKLVDRNAYTYQRHVDWVRSLLDQLAVRDLTLLCQDWGGLIGLRLVGEEPARFAAVLAANTFLPTGDRPPPPAFLQWQAFSQNAPVLPVGGIVTRGCARPVAPEVTAAYDAPFPDERYKAAARIFPTLVPVTPDDPASAANRAAWQGLERFERPFLTVFGDKDPITGGAERVLIQKIPGARAQPHTILPNVGHFIQEDAGEALGDHVVALVRAAR